MEPVAFEPVPGVTRVTVAVPPNAQIVVVEAGFQTDDSSVIAALDDQPNVQRVGGPLGAGPDAPTETGSSEELIAEGGEE